MNRLKSIRKKQKLTLDDIAKLTGINRGTYNNYENCKTNPTDKMWQKLADFFGVSVPYLQGAYHCSNCGNYFYNDDSYHYYQFCPYCGVKL